MMEPEIIGRARLRIAVTLRLAVDDDPPALEWMGLFSPHRGLIQAAFDSQWRGYGLMLLAVPNGFPVGQVWIDLARKRKEGVAVLWAVRSFPALQGAGIGGRLIDAADRLLRARGVTRAELGVERENDRARRFYERHGWRVVGPSREVLSTVTPEGRQIEEVLDEWRMVKAF